MDNTIIRQKYFHVIRCLICDWSHRYISPFKGELLDMFVITEHGYLPGHIMHFRISNRDDIEDITEWCFHL